MVSKAIYDFENGIYSWFDRAMDITAAYGHL